ncbi:MAG: nitrous oxide reductase accessory protein NosL [Balneolaceae bacterium]
MQREISFFMVIMVLLFMLTGCTERSSENPAIDRAEFSQIDYGKAICEFEHVVIDEFRYGGKLETKSGDVFTFMSVECLAGYYLNNLNESQIKNMWVTDFNHGKMLIPVEEAVFLHSKNRKSPNGLNLTALKADDEKITFNMRFAYGGDLIGWEEVLQLVQKEWNINRKI